MRLVLVAETNGTQNHVDDAFLSLKVQVSEIVHPSNTDIKSCSF